MLRRPAAGFAVVVLALALAAACAQPSAPMTGEDGRFKSPVGDKTAGKLDGDAPENGESDDDRKIIHTASVELATESLETGESALLALVKTHGGRIASSNVAGDAGSWRRGSWTVRVPVTKFEDFLAAVVRMGEALSVSTDSDDVTEQWVDIDARLIAKKEEEKRLLAHLRESTGNLKQILDVERELSRVRQEIESMQGTLRSMANKVELATIVVSLVERIPYQSPVAPAFVSRIGYVFGQSLGALLHFGQAIVLVVTALVPWLLAAVPFVLGGTFAVRRFVVPRLFAPKRP